MLNRPVEQFRVTFFQFTGNRRFFFRFVTVFFLVPAQQITAQYWCQCQGDNRGSAQRSNESDSQRGEQTSLHTGQEEKGDETGYDNQRRVQNRHTHLSRSLENHSQQRPAFLMGQIVVLPQPFENILHIDDGVIDQ